MSDPASNPAATQSVTDMLLPLAAGLVVSSFLGSYASGASIADVATAMNGGLGATVGVGAGIYLAPQAPEQLQKILPLLLGLAVPAIVGGEIDVTTVALGAGAAGGAYFATQYSNKL